MWNTHFRSTTQRGPYAVRHSAKCRSFSHFVRSARLPSQAVSPYLSMESEHSTLEKFFGGFEVQTSSYGRICGPAVLVPNAFGMRFFNSGSHCFVACRSINFVAHCQNNRFSKKLNNFQFTGKFSSFSLLKMSLHVARSHACRDGLRLGMVTFRVSKLFPARTLQKFVQFAEQYQHTKAKSPPAAAAPTNIASDSNQQAAWQKTAIGEVGIELGTKKRVMRFASGQYARFADGCVTVSFGDTSVLVTTVGRTTMSSGGGFVPLSVDYRQKAAAAGRIPTNFLRRELGSSEREILTARIIDRSVRPLFDKPASGKAPTTEVQITCNTLALDGDNDPDILCINGASAALAISNIPWNGPIAAVRVGRVGTELIINPTRREMMCSDLNLVVAANSRNRVVMLEADAKGVMLSDFQQAIKTGVKECQKIIRELQAFRQQVGKPKRDLSAKRPASTETDPATDPDTRLQASGLSFATEADVVPSPLPLTSIADVEQAVYDISSVRLRDVFTNFSLDKIARDEAVKAVRDDIVPRLRASFPLITDAGMFHEAFSNVTKKVFRRQIFDTNIRCDGRQLTEIRPISCQVDLYRPLHGSALFQRGQTQCLCTVTFDSIDSALKNDAVSIITGGLKEKNFFLHYEFPQYATNEIGRGGGARADRREMGHGALAEKALRSVIPDNFPYTIRLTSEVLESNGSSSMASACGGSLALMDAGVPIKSPVAGVAIGLVSVPENLGAGENDNIQDYRLLTDLLGIEDYLGDMDFKFAGTANGVTALQADIKLAGLPLKIVMEALQHANEAKNKILGIMNNCLSAPRADAKENSPVSETIEVLAHNRSRFIGVGGRNLKKITAETGCQVSSMDDTHFLVFAPNQAAMDEARQLIDKILAEEQEPQLEFGAIYEAEIVEIRDSGVMLSLHARVAPIFLGNAQLDSRRVNHASALGFQVGQKLNVKYFGRDPATGYHRISRKTLQLTTHVGVKKLLAQ